MSHRHFKERQSRRLNWIIQQEQADIEAQRLRDEKEQVQDGLGRLIRWAEDTESQNSKDMREVGR